MSNDKVKEIRPNKAAKQQEVAEPTTPATPPMPDMPPPPPPSVPNERLMDIDRMALELAKSQRQTALAEAKTALAQNEKAELAYKYVVLQLYMKYGLTERDAISEAGEIIRGGAIQVPQAR
jgi:hypothetical protein